MGVAISDISSSNAFQALTITRENSHQGACQPVLQP